MSMLKKLAKNLLKEAVSPKPQPQVSSQQISWSAAAKEYVGNFGFFYMPSEGDEWHVAVPADLLDVENAKADKRRKSARVLEIESIYDADDLAERKAEIKEDIPREDYDTDAEWKEDIKAEMECLNYEIKWNDMMIIVPVQKANGERLAVAVREKDAVSIGYHEL